MTPADVSVVIAAKNEAASIATAVQSAQVCGARETIVVDGGSEDETKRRAATAGARVIDAAPGRGCQLAAGARVAEGAVLLFLHADSRLAEPCLRQVVTAFQQWPDRWGGAFRQRIESERTGYRLLEWGNRLRVRVRGLPFGDQAIFVRRADYEAVGGFAEVPLMEDVMLSMQLRKRAYPLLLQGPVYVSPRRWERHGIVRQTLKNFSIQAAFWAGASPEELARRYDK